MEIKNFIQNFIDALELEDGSAIDESTEFRSLDVWDSLAALSIISMVDDEYHVTINNKDLREAKNIAELFAMIKSKL